MQKDKTAAAINFFKAAVLLAIILSIFNLHDALFIKKFALTVGIVVCGLNDFLRIRFWQGKIVWAFNLSIMLSIVGAGFYCYLFENLPAAIYLIFPLAEIFAHSANPVPLVAFHFAVFAAAVCINFKSHLSVNLLTYAGITLILFLFRNISIERKKEQLLNEELTSTNAKLKEYSERVQKMTVMEERTRIAQELHDSIGHGLVALGMNLEFAESTINADSVKAEAAVHRAHDQSKKCMSDLRKAVAALKSDVTDKSASLQESLYDMFRQLQPECVRFSLSFDPQVEKESPAVKDCLYKTVREAVTNGIHHGKASLFTISISKEAETITVSVKDNGTGCTEFKKSDGLTGIEKRVASLGGKVNFSTAPNNGFCVSAAIPSAARDGGNRS